MVDIESGARHETLANEIMDIFDRAMDQIPDILREATVRLQCSGGLSSEFVVKIKKGPPKDELYDRVQEKSKAGKLRSV